MTFDEFKTSLASDTAPANLSSYLTVLWLDAKGDWDGAHDALQEDNSKTSAWVHAYLHRKEGDAANANYWYRRADRTMPEETLEQEWESITKALLAK